MSRKQYRLLLLVLWLYTFVWAAAVIIVDFILPLQIVAKVLITLILIVLTPTDGHFMTYDKYRRWHEQHVIVEEKPPETK